MLKNSKSLKISILLLGTLRGLQIWPLNMSAQNLGVFEIDIFFLGFSQNFSEILGIKLFIKLEITIEKQQ